MAPIVTSLASITKQFGIGGLAAGPSFSATGGTITESGGKTIHTFTSSGAFVVSGGAGEVECLVIAGGGGGGTNHGGGGGAGGLLYGTSFSVSSTSYPVVVGSGGATAIAYPPANANGSNGSNTTFSGPFGTATATGGGGGGSRGSSYDATGSAGGSGGGGGWPETGTSYPGGPGTQAPQVSGTLTGYGFAGGNASNNGGGGGGAGGLGGNAPGTISPPSGGNPGPGRSYSISGSSVTYSVGGQGGTYPGWSNPSPPAAPGAGSGGNGGAGAYGRGTNGQDGIVIIAYPS
jgi:mucin-19